MGSRIYQGIAWRIDLKFEPLRSNNIKPVCCQRHGEAAKAGRAVLSVLLIFPHTKRGAKESKPAAMLEGFKSNTANTTRSPSRALLPFSGEGSPTNIDYRRKRVDTLILSSLEDLDHVYMPQLPHLPTLQDAARGSTPMTGDVKSKSGPCGVPSVVVPSATLGVYDGMLIQWMMGKQCQWQTLKYLTSRYRFGI